MSWLVITLISCTNFMLASSTNDSSWNFKGIILEWLNWLNHQDVLRLFFQLTHGVVHRALSGILIRLLHQTLEGFLHFGSSSHIRRVIRHGDRCTVICTYSRRKPLFSHDDPVDGFHNKARHSSSVSAILRTVSLLHCSCWGNHDTINDASVGCWLSCFCNAVAAATAA